MWTFPYSKLNYKVHKEGSLTYYQYATPSPMIALLIVFVTLRISLSIPSAPGMFGFFLKHKTIFWLTAHLNCTNDNGWNIFTKELYKKNGVVCILYINFLKLYLIIFTQKISPRHVHRWAGLSAHTKKKDCKRRETLVHCY